MRELVMMLMIAGGTPAMAGELAEYHSKHSRNKPAAASRTWSEVQSTGHGVTELGIERTGCYGKCPAYTFIAKSDGTFRYHGEADVEKVGDFTGRVSTWQFHHLAQFIKDSDYLGLEDSYASPVTDNPTVYTLVAMNGKRKVVSNYANGGPTKLWAIEQLIDDLLRGAQWDGPPKGKGR